MCGAVRTDRGVVQNFEKEAENMMKGQQFLHGMGELLSRFGSVKTQAGNSYD